MKLTNKMLFQIILHYSIYMLDMLYVELNYIIKRLNLKLALQYKWADYFTKARLVGSSVPWRVWPKIISYNYLF